MEQEEYQQFVHTHAKTNHHLYNFIHPDIWNYFKVTYAASRKKFLIGQCGSCTV